ncbi:hypothetical protein ACFV1N_25545 [Streptosporangium canum]|uniref:hypothetical protein n=1 Tax=Streptosporangium canum TaxID=324952 RepID=UPI0036AAD387
MIGPRIVMTAGELAAVAASLDPAAPVILGAAELDAGADAARDDTWVLVAEQVQLPADEDGQAAGPGRQPALVEELSADGVTRRLAGVPALLVRPRQLAVPGQLGIEALPADPAVRRAQAFAEPDGDMSRYLMELVAALGEVGEEVGEAIEAEHQPLSPAARRRLERAIRALEAAREQVGEAGRYGNSCELARLGIVDDDQVCDPWRHRDAWVFLPSPTGDGPGYEEPGCGVHAAAAVRTIQGARVGPPTV